MVSRYIYTSTLVDWMTASSKRIDKEMEITDSVLVMLLSKFVMPRSDSQQKRLFAYTAGGEEEEVSRFNGIDQSLHGNLASINLHEQLHWSSLISTLSFSSSSCSASWSFSLISWSFSFCSLWKSHHIHPYLSDYLFQIQD